MMSDAPQVGPLSGTTVLSLAEQLPGPYAGLLLADLGADVILVERKNGGDPARAIPAFFEALSRNKRSVTLDLKVEAERDELFRLVRRADVLMEGYSPGTVERLGIDYATLSAINPKLVYASVSGFGQTGPYRSRAGHDISYQAAAGFLADHLRELGPAPFVPIGDIAAGMFTALAIVAALQGRERSGAGTFIDVSLTESLVSWMTPLLGPILNGGARLDVGNSPGYGTFRCADGRVLTLSIAHEDHFWRSLCGVLQLPELAAIPHAERMRNPTELRRRVAARIETNSLDHWAVAFDAARVPWSPVYDLAGVTDDAHLLERGMFQSVDVGQGEAWRYVAHPVQFSAWPRPAGRLAPRLGEHNAEILER